MQQHEIYGISLTFRHSWVHQDRGQQKLAWLGSHCQGSRRLDWGYRQFAVTVFCCRRFIDTTFHLCRATLHGISLTKRFAALRFAARLFADNILSTWRRFANTSVQLKDRRAWTGKNQQKMHRRRFNFWLLILCCWSVFLWFSIPKQPRMHLEQIWIFLCGFHSTVGRLNGLQRCRVDDCIRARNWDGGLEPEVGVNELLANLSS